MKKKPAILAALITTLLLGGIMLAVGVNAFFTPNTTVSAASGASDSAGLSAQLQQAQDLIAQYQAREKQYQEQLSQAREQIQQAAGQAQEYQSILEQLQSMGVISIRDGQIFVGRGVFGGRDGNNSAPDSLAPSQPGNGA